MIETSSQGLRYAASVVTNSMTRTEQLIAAEHHALALLDRIEQLGFIQAGRTEREVEQDILGLAAGEFGIERHWHKRIVRTGVNTLAIAGDNPPILTIGEDDIVFLDLGPVFDGWEADVGKSYAVGGDARKHRLCADLEDQFDLITARFRSDPAITGVDLYRFACNSAREAGWTFGGKIAGHIVAEFPHARLPGPKQAHHISPDNPDRLRLPDANGAERHWILEVHLIDPEGRFGGFYERLMLDLPALTDGD